jgi:hypothetical protein
MDTSLERKRLLPKWKMGKNSSTERKRRDFYPENKNGSLLLIDHLINQAIGQHVR